MGTGGPRPNSGRPRKDSEQHWLSGDAGKRGQGKKPPTKPPVKAVAEPDDLSDEAARVWRDLAPHAIAARTLTTATVGDMRALCELVVEMRAALAARRASGFDDTGLRLAREYRGLVQRVESKSRAFRLAPMGREMVTEDAQVVDPWAELDPEPSDVQ